MLSLHATAEVVQSDVTREVCSGVLQVVSELLQPCFDEPGLLVEGNENA